MTSGTRRAALSLTTIGAATLLTVGVVLFLASGAPAATPLYPDLKIFKAYELRFDTATIDGTSHNVLRFSTKVWNAGEGALELRAKTVGTSSGKKTRVWQRIYDDAGGYTTKNVGDMIYHPSHAHFHLENFARYELWTRADYDNWVASGRAQGQAQRRGTKTSFCLLDAEKLQVNLPGSPSSAYYTQCGQTFQGISVGWADKYGSHLPEQWIDLGTSNLPDGQYVLRFVTDPANQLYESANRSDPTRESELANEAVRFFSVQGSTITLTG
jgi:hypothetical protein